MKPIGWLLGTSIYDVRQCDDAGFGAFYPDQTAIYSEHAKETILSTIRQAKVEVLRDAAADAEKYIDYPIDEEDITFYGHLEFMARQLRRIADELEKQ